MARKFTYRVNPNDPASVERYAKTQAKRAARQGGNFQGFVKDDYKLFRPAKGDNYIRILPPTWEDADHYAIDVWSHYNVGPESATVLCLAKMKGKPCPLCEARLKANRADDEELAKELAPRQQSLVWLVNMKAKDDGPMIWAMGWTVEREFAKLSRDKESGASLLLDDPDEGYNIGFEREGERDRTRYGGFQVGRRASSIDDEWLNYVTEHPLPDCLVWRDYDEIQALFEGSPSSGDDDDDGPKSRRGRSSRDDDDRPARSARRGRSAEPDDDDDRPARRGRDDDDDDRPAARMRDRRSPESPAPRGGSRRSRDDDDDDSGTRSVNRAADRASSRRDAEPDDDDRPARSSRRGRDDDDDRPARRGRDAEPDDDDDDRPARSSRRGRDAEPDDDDRPARRGNGSAREAEPAPRTRARVAPRKAAPDDEDDAPSGRRRADNLRERFGR